MKFEAKAGWVYQIRASRPEPRVGYGTDTYLRLYNAAGNLLAESDNYFMEDAEIWYWNSGPDQWLYVQVTEAKWRVGCGLWYNLSVTPWSPEAFRARFRG